MAGEDAWMRCPLMDPRRWGAFRARADDIFIVAPVKCGTTWMQEIVASLLWPQGPPSVATSLSPWLDSRARPTGEVLAQLEATTRRRFIKTHTPADALPSYEQCRFVAVLRNPADALASWQTIGVG